MSNKELHEKRGEAFKEYYEKRGEAFKAFAKKCIDVAHILDVVSPVVELKKKGSTYFGLCPFHPEKTPSFTVNAVGNYYNCFGCGAGGDAVKFVMESKKLPFIDAIESIGKYYNIADDRENLEAPNQSSEVQTSVSKPITDISKPVTAPKAAPKEIEYISMEKVNETLKRYENNRFAQFLINYFGVDIATDLLKKWKIGTSKHWNGANIFWSWNDKGANDGKIAFYDPITGKRDKTKQFSNVSSKMGISDKRPPKTLFGDWQLEGNNKVVAIVESEKTAICMSVICPNFCWLATGGKGGFKFDSEAFNGLKNSKIIVIPDKDGLERWQIECENGFMQGFDIIKVFSKMENWNANDDILDVAMRQNWYKPVAKPLQTVLDENEKNFAQIWGFSASEMEAQKERSKEFIEKELSQKELSQKAKELSQKEYEQKELNELNAKIQSKTDECERVARELHKRHFDTDICPF